MSNLSFKRVLYCAVFLSGLSVLACSPKKNKSSHLIPNFDSLYVEISTRISATQSDSAFLLAEFLMENAASSEERMRVQMLLATLYERNGNFAKAIALAKQAYLLAKKDKNDNWLLRINGFLSTSYREIGLFDYGKTYLKEASTIIDKTGTPILKAFILQEKSFYNIEDKEYKTALLDLQESNEIITGLIGKVPNNSFFGATNSQMIGICYNELGELDSAKAYFKISLDSLGNFETELKGFNYVGLARTEIAKDELVNAKVNLEKCGKYVENSKNSRLKKLLLEGYIEYYAKTGDKHLELETQQAYLNAKQEEEKTLRTVFEQIIEDSVVSVKSSENKSLKYLYLTILVSIIAGVFLYYFYLKNKRQKKIFSGILQRLLADRNFILNESRRMSGSQMLLNEADVYNQVVIKAIDDRTLDADELLIEDAHIVEDDTSKEKADNEGKPAERNSKRKMSIPKESFDKIVEKLNQFEEDKLYLNPEMSLASLASITQVNVKYLSYVINDYKGYDFNSYINRLRISYIINKLESEPEYLNYKIAFLAEECGFISHSKFAVIFKQILGMSPSDFIKHLKTETK